MPTASGGTATIIYITEYGNAPANITGRVIENSAINIYESDLIAPDYTGLTFLGWYTTPTFDEGTKVSAGRLSVGTDNDITITFYAKWSITVKTAMTNIANPIRNLLNTTSTLTIDNMNTNLDTTIAAVSDMKAALTEKGIDASGANTIGDVRALVSGIAGKYPNGTSWTPSNITSGSFYYVAYGNGLWVACSSDETGLYYSTDGKTWIQSNIQFYSFLHCIYANGIWAACNTYSKYLYYSTDGITWVNGNTIGPALKYIAYANGVWIVCGYGLYYSIDGTNWTQSNITDSHFKYCANANGIWVACSISNGLYYSIDGMTWTQSNITSGDFNHCVNANGIWIACTKYEGVYSSTDGITWTQIADVGFKHIAYANGVWVACVDAYGSFYSTDNGITWWDSNWFDGLEGQADGYYATNANGIWLRCEYSSETRNGIKYSYDGITWGQASPLDIIFNYCTNANGIWVAGSKNNGLYYSVTWDP